MLRELLAQVRARAKPGDALVFVGDYIDRGRDSRGVADLVLEQMGGGWEGPVTPLRGNHEELMLDSLLPRPRYDLEIWMQNGGVETVASYTPDGWSPDWIRAVPPAHLEFFRNLKSWHRDENGIYVHAGLPPGVAPEDATDEDRLWIRGAFINSDWKWDRVVVFGHTPQYDQSPRLLNPRKMPWRPLNRPEKIGIDTGAAYGGPLTAVMLPEREFFSVK
jgi:serine/threonine protein phosphatase 1